MTTSAPETRYWQLQAFHPITGAPIGYTWPAPLTCEAAAKVVEALITTYTVTDLIWQLDDGSGLVAAIVLFTIGNTQRLTCIAATDTDDAVVRMAALASDGTLVPLA